MPKFVVTKTIQYTEEVTVEADDRDSAIALAEEKDGIRNNDESVFEIQARLIPGE